jgi:predicted dehydrogenase
MEALQVASGGPATRPRLGFLGVGWIGRMRMASVAASGLAEVVGVADASPDARLSSAAEGVECVDSLDALLALGLDGVVIATPSALHAEQCIRALEAGCAVFCQKPLARDAGEAGRVVDTARAADRLLAVDLSYRHTRGMRRVRELVRSGELGRVFALDLVFHNAYGPDKPWFYDRGLSGGGCVMDLGVHLVDLALWTLDFPEVRGMDARLFAGGLPLQPGSGAVEDYAVAQMELEGGVVARIACSWRLNAGQDAVIGVEVQGTAAGARMANVGGSFVDFVTERMRGTARETLEVPPEDWGGGAALEWTARLAAGERFDPACERLIQLSRLLDRIYQR